MSDEEELNALLGVETETVAESLKKTPPETPAEPEAAATEATPEPKETAETTPEAAEPSNTSDDPKTVPVAVIQEQRARRQEAQKRAGAAENELLQMRQQMLHMQQQIMQAQQPQKPQERPAVPDWFEDPEGREQYIRQQQLQETYQRDINASRYRVSKALGEDGARVVGEAENAFVGSGSQQSRYAGHDPQPP